MAAPGRKRQFFGTPKNSLFRPGAAPKKSGVVFGKDFHGPRPFLEASQHRAGNGAANKMVLDLIFVTFCYIFKAFLGRQPTLARDPKILQKMHSPQSACWISGLDQEPKKQQKTCFFEQKRPPKPTPPKNNKNTFLRAFRRVPGG